MDIKEADNRTRIRKINSFTDAIKDKYCIDQIEQPSSFEFVILTSPKRKNGAAQAELAHLNTVVLNGLNLNFAGIPQQGLTSLCPNIVDLDLANNLFSHWSELITILTHLPKVRYVNVSKNNLQLDCANELPQVNLSVENLALNCTGVAIQEIVHLSQIMPVLKELHLCGNDYEILDDVDRGIKNGYLSNLECLRLNNNKINSWSEVWKLRHLPQLKHLVLSGNPLTSIYYSLFDEQMQNKMDEDGTNFLERTEGKAEHKPNSVSDEDIFLQTSHTDCDDLIDADDIECEFQDLSFSTLECDDDDSRPISRIARHDDSIVTDDDGCSSDRENTVNINSNNSGHLFPKAALYEQIDDDNANFELNTQEEFDANTALIDSLIEADMFDEEEEDEDDEYHKSIAEAFLQEIIDHLVADQVVEGLSQNYSQTISPVLQDVPQDNLQIAEFDRRNVEEDNSTISLCSTDSTRPEPMSENIDLENSGTVPTTTCKTDIPTTLEEQQDKVKNSPEVSNIEDVNTVVKDLTEESSESINSLVSDKLLAECLSQHTDSNQLQSSSDIPLEENQILSNYNQNAICDNPRQQTNVHPSVDDVSHFTISPPSKDNSSSKKKLFFVSQNEKTNFGDDQNTSCDSCGDISDAILPQCNSENISDNSIVEPNCYNCDQPQSSNDPVPFQCLENLCLSEAKISHWTDIAALQHFPCLTNIRMLSNPLYSSVNPEDRRKLYISSLPKVTILNGSEVTVTEREKAERHYLRHFMDEENKPDIYHTLVDKHGPPVKLVEIDLSAGYKEFVSLTFIVKESEYQVDGKSKFTKKVRMQGCMGSLRKVISKEIKIPKQSFIMFHSTCGPAHPEYDRDIIELRCEGLPMSRFDFLDGDEIHIELKG